MFASLYLSRLIIGDCLCHRVFWWSDKGNVSQVAVKNDLQSPFLILLHYLLKVQEDCEWAQTLWSTLDWRSWVLCTLWSSASCVLYQDHFLVWKTPLHLPLPAFPFFLLLPGQVSSVCIGSYNSLCFLAGKHVIVSSLVIQVTCYWMCKTGLAEDHVAWSLSV